MALVDPAQRIAAELGPGESLLWTGRPRRKWDLEPSDIANLGFGLFFCGILAALLFMNRLLGSSHGLEWFWIAIVLFSSLPPFVAKGIEVLRRRKTLYGITNKRILVLTDFLGHTKTSFDLRTLSDLSVSEKRDGSGTVHFGHAPFFSVARRGLKWPGLDWYSPRKLDRVDDAHTVYETLVDARKKAA